MNRRIFARCASSAAAFIMVATQIVPGTARAGAAIGERTAPKRTSVYSGKREDGRTVNVFSDGLVRLYSAKNKVVEYRKIPRTEVAALKANAEGSVAPSILAAIQLAHHQAYAPNQL